MPGYELTILGSQGLSRRCTARFRPAWGSSGRCSDERKARAPRAAGPRPSGTTDPPAPSVPILRSFVNKHSPCRRERLEARKAWRRPELEATVSSASCRATIPATLELPDRAQERGPSCTRARLVAPRANLARRHRQCGRLQEPGAPMTSNLGKHHSIEERPGDGFRPIKAPRAHGLRAGATCPARRILRVRRL